MSEVSFASLNPTLLARKGGAKPAMRPQLAATISSLPAAANAINEAALEDLGWNDLGEGSANDTAEIVELTPPQGRRAQIATAPQGLTKSKPRRKAKTQGKRAAFTLRLDPERHLKLRLASTVRDVSAQELVTEALDALLDTMPEVIALASQVDKK